MGHKEYAGQGKRKYVQGGMDSRINSTPTAAAMTSRMRGLNRTAYGNPPGFQLPGQIRVLDEELALKLLQYFALPF